MAGLDGGTWRIGLYRRLRIARGGWERVRRAQEMFAVYRMRIYVNNSISYVI
jgi:hypothetical protein